MKKYSVREIAKILNTNPETVRRWIRTGKLESEISSRKAGNIVTEKMFNKFLESNPKYQEIAKQIGEESLVRLEGISRKNCFREQREENRKYKSKTMVELLERDIEKRRQAVKHKQAAIEQLRLEIEEDNKQIEEYIRFVNVLKKHTQF